MKECNAQRIFNYLYSTSTGLEFSDSVSMHGHFKITDSLNLKYLVSESRRELTKKCQPITFKYWKLIKL